MRGRIHAQNDVINGVSGMEHLSSTIGNRKGGNPNASPAIVAQMRSSPYNHHASQPESVIMEQLKNVNLGNQNLGGGLTPSLVSPDALKAS